MDDIRRTKDDGVMIKAHIRWAKQSLGRYVAPLGHIILIPSQPVNLSLLFLLNAAFLAEKQQIPILYSFVWQDRSSYPQSITLEASTLTITLPMRFRIFIFYFILFNQNFLLSLNILFENKNESKTIRVTWYLCKHWEFLLLFKHSLNIAIIQLHSK